MCGHHQTGETRLSGHREGHLVTRRQLSCQCRDHLESALGDRGREGGEKEGERKRGRERRKEEGRERRKEGGRERGREGGEEGGREGGRERGRERGREGGRKRGRERRKERDKYGRGCRRVHSAQYNVVENVITVKRLYRITHQEQRRLGSHSM